EFQRNGPPHYGAWGAMGELQMNSKLTKLATAGFLSLCAAAPALAGSVTQPGETVGLNAGAPLPPGWYAINTVDWGCRNTNPQHTCTGLTIPVVAWSTPWTFWGARFQLLAAWPAVEAGVIRDPGLGLPGTYFVGMYNPAVFGQLAWDLGYGWGFSYLLGAYFDYHSPVAWSDTSINQRFALSYTANDWALTANVIWGIHTESVTDRPQLSPCPVRSEEHTSELQSRGHLVCRLPLEKKKKRARRRRRRRGRGVDGRARLLQRAASRLRRHPRPRAPHGLGHAAGARRDRPRLLLPRRL